MYSSHTNDNQNQTSVPTPTAPPPDPRLWRSSTPPFYVNAPPTTVRWSTGLCGGSSCGNWCVTFWCPWITFGQIAEIVDEGLTSCPIGAALYALSKWFGVCCIYSGFYRSRLRAKYALKESPCNDYIVHCCCEPCALRQEYRELENRGFDMSIGWQANMELQNRRMTVPPNFGGEMKR